MPDPEIPDNFDFRGLATEAQQAFRPHYADVVQRAGRRRNTARVAGAAAIVAGVAAGGGTAIGVLDRDGAPGPMAGTPSASATGSPLPGSSRLPAPQPSFTEIAPGAYDVTRPDVPLTDLFTELKAGDLDHLYLEYQDCATSACTRMVAATADRGRTWHALRMPAGLVTAEKTNNLVAVQGTTLVARDSTLVAPDMRTDGQAAAETYWTSTDGGATWRQPAVRPVDALPAGWPVMSERNSLAAFDPATGDIARLTKLPQSLRLGGPLFRTPVTAGIWTQGLKPNDGRIAMVSRDGGRTWDERPVPDAVTRTRDGGTSFNDNQLATADGQTVYTIEKLGDRVRVHVSTDGAVTWRAGAVVDLDGPLLSLLPTADGALLIEGPTATFRSTDRARTFTRVGPSRGGRAYAIPGGYAIPTNNNEFSVWLSPDGVDWSYVARPDVP